MKKILSYIGLTTIACISFMISEQTTTVLKDIDGLLIELKEQSKNYYEEPINATIKNDKLIPGLYGKKINIDKTYGEMKKIGTINEKYFIYDEIKPEITIENQYEKYIVSGNPKKKMISLLFIINDNENIDNIINILEKNNTKANFFANKQWLINNQNITDELIKKGHTVGIKDNDSNSNNIEYNWANNFLKKLEKQKIVYCYTETENEKNLQVCASQKKYTVMPGIITTNKPLLQIKKNIKDGSIISMPINTNTNKELQLIINYIQTKGYTIETLPIHLDEKNKD